MNEFGTWLFLSKFKRKVENVLQGWTFPLNTKKESSLRQKPKNRERRYSDNEDEDDEYSDSSDDDTDDERSHMDALGRYDYSR